MQIGSISLVAMLLIGVSLARTLAQDAPVAYGSPISLADARRVLSAAEKEASANGWKMVFAIVDSGGNLVLLERMNDAQIGSVAVAQQKARAAVAFRRPTKAFEDMVADAPAGLRILGLEGVVPIEGGIPLTVNEQVVGAIGVSGGTAVQDGQVARAGAAALVAQAGSGSEWWRQGQPPAIRDSPLRPHTAPAAAAPAAAIPVHKLRLPPGFRAELWAHGLPNARSLALGARGTVFVGTRFAGAVYAIVDRGGERVVKTVATGLHRPNGVAFRDGALYVAEVSRLLRFDDIESALDRPPAPRVVLDGLPRDEAHGWKSLALGPDGKLYFGIGAPCNICPAPDPYAQIVRFDVRTRTLETVARGVRNTLGLDWHPETGDLYFSENGHDWMGDDRPEDELNRASSDGLHFGFPFCHQGDLPDPAHAGGRRCGEFTPPILKLGPHVAALGMKFYRGRQFPPEYRHSIFVALHGSWNRTEKTGFAVMRVALPASGPPISSEFVTGFLDEERFWGRPVDVLERPDGSLLVSDDWNGAIYRISHEGPGARQ